VKHFIVYVLQCMDGSYYCGHTDDLVVRMRQHEEGDIGYTRDRKPLQLLWQGEFETRQGALAFELQVKGWSRAKKEALIRGDWEGIQRLARSKSSSFQSVTHSPFSVRPEPPNSVRPEPVEGAGGDASPRLRQAQPERGGVVPQRQTDAPNSVRPEAPLSVRPEARLTAGAEATPAVRPAPLHSVRPEPVEGLVQAVLQRDPVQQRRGMAKAITLIESTRPDHRDEADALLTQLLPHTGQSLRLGLSGVPGVGKSTFIEALGLHLIEQGHRVAVLTIDPSSTVSGGSILGDKTRMEKLSVHPQAYIRPSPSSGTLGGVAEKTREVMLVCEAAGYDIVIVETVGVGQSELAVARMTDMFVLMQLPNAGDDLQAIKKGVMELADLVLINKADLDADAATRAQAQISSALHLLGAHVPPNAALEAAPLWQPRVIQVSALQGQGINQFWALVTQFRSQQHAGGLHTDRRQQQAVAWMWERIDHDLKLAFRQHPQVQAMLPTLTADVTAGRMPASTAARQLLGAWRTSLSVRAEPVQAPANKSKSPSTGSGRTEN
jgi:LAO/AO transport system kinase